MDDFSWSDSVRAAIAPCLPCFSAPSNSPSDGSSSHGQGSGTPSTNTSRTDLAHLLADPTSDIDDDAEALSLHSANPGRRRRSRSKKQKAPKFSLTLFGYTFGRQPIYLDGDSDDDLIPSGRPIPIVGTASSSTLDSDAAPLDAAAIQRLASPPPQKTPEQVEVEQRMMEEEEERRRERAERKARRRERRERERDGALQALNGDPHSRHHSIAELEGGEGEFEGFQGDALPEDASFYGPYSAGLPHEHRMFIEQPQQQQLVVPDDGSGSDDADLGGELYTRKKRGSMAAWHGMSGSDSNSNSNSRTSASGASSHARPHPASRRMSLPTSAHLNLMPPFQAQQQQAQFSVGFASPQSQYPSTAMPNLTSTPKKANAKAASTTTTIKPKRRTSTAPSSSASATTASERTLHSPVQSISAAYAPSPLVVVSGASAPAHQDQGQGRYFDEEEEASADYLHGLPSAGLPSAGFSSKRGFPSAGLTSSGGTERKRSKSATMDGGALHAYGQQLGRIE